MKFVESLYKNRWKGVVLDVTKRSSMNFCGRTLHPDPLYTVLIVFDQHGNKITKRIIKISDCNWFKECKSFDISWVNPDWFKI